MRWIFPSGGAGGDRAKRERVLDADSQMNDNVALWLLNATQRLHKMNITPVWSW